MKDLLRNENPEEKNPVSARALYDYLEIKSKFADWIKNRIKKYGFIENEDYVSVSIFLENGGREIDYALTLDCAKEISMVQGNAKGKEARKYFIACEKRLKEITQKPLTMAQMFAMQAQVNLEFENRVSVVENKVDAIIQKQQEAEQELKALPVATESVPELPLRDKIRMMINRYAALVNIDQKTIWDNVYTTLYYNYHISLKSYKKKNKSESWLDVAERVGIMDKIFIVVSNLIRGKGLVA